MSTEAERPLGLGLSEGLGPNALTYARERVSLLGAGEHMDTVNRALDALEGLPGAALLGGWTFKGFTAWAQGLESEIARLTSALKKANDQAEHFERAWCLRGDVLEAVRQYGADTLSGRTDGPDDRAWQRAAVLEMARRARLGLGA